MKFCSLNDIPRPVRLAGLLVIALGVYALKIAARSFNHWPPEAARKSCEGQLSGISTALQAYVSDHKGKYPQTLDALPTEGYIVRKKWFQICPSVTYRRSEDELHPGMEGSYVYLAGGLSEPLDRSVVIVVCGECGKSDVSIRMIMADGDIIVLNGREAEAVLKAVAGSSRPVVYNSAANHPSTRPVESPH